MEYKYKLYATSHTIPANTLGEILASRKKMGWSAFTHLIPACQIYEVTGLNKEICPLNHNKMVEYYKSKIYKIDCYYLKCHGISYFFIRNIDKIN
jgi:hypothetical protein